MGKSPLILAALAKAAVPSLTFTSVKKLSASGSGRFDSALLTASSGDHFVIRTPESRAGALELDVESQVLRTLGSPVRSTLPFKITRQLGETRDSRKQRVVLFEFLYGNQLEPERISPSSPLAGSIGAAIAAIHDLDAEVIRAAGLPEFSAQELVRRLVAELDEIASVGEVSAALLSRWEAALEDVSLFRYQPVVVHGELSAETMLELDAEVAAVLNWGSLHIGDPAEDLTWLASNLHPELFESVMMAYAKSVRSKDPSLAQRATLYNELSHARWLLHCIRMGDEQAIADARQEIAYLTEEHDAALLMPLAVSAFTVAASTGAFIPASSTEGEVEDLQTEPVEEETDKSEAAVDEEPEISAVDDKTREIELPEKTDDELF
jgi:aminoglycoside phosphotransferase (APT) family kinase protein